MDQKQTHDETASHRRSVWMVVVSSRATGIHRVVGWGIMMRWGIGIGIVVRPTANRISTGFGGSGEIHCFIFCVC